MKFTRWRATWHGGRRRFVSRRIFKQAADERLDSQLRQGARAVKQSTRLYALTINPSTFLSPEFSFLILTSSFLPFLLFSALLIGKNLG